jgi:hypothetical protein
LMSFDQHLFLWKHGNAQKGLGSPNIITWASLEHVTEMHSYLYQSHTLREESPNYQVLYIKWGKDEGSQFYCSVF